MATASESSCLEYFARATMEEIAGNPEITSSPRAEALGRLLEYVSKHASCSIPFDDSKPRTLENSDIFPVVIMSDDDMDQPGGLLAPSPGKYLRLVEEYDRVSGFSWSPLDGKEQSVGGIAIWLLDPTYSVPFVGLGVGLGIFEWTGRWEIVPEETIEQFHNRVIEENTARFRTVNKLWKAVDTDPTNPTGMA